MERSDAELIRAVLQGDIASFEPLVTKYSPRLFATARRYARREDEIEDIVQEIWSKAYHKLGQLSRRRALRALAHAHGGADLLRLPARAPAQPGKHLH